MTAVLSARRVSLPRRLVETGFELRAGELACLVGPNGSGKTSLLHALARIGRPGGAVEIDGIDLDTAAPAQRRQLFSYLGAQKDIAWPLSVRDLVALGNGEGDVPQALDRLGLTTLTDRRIDRISTGERSRALIARALVGTPRVLLMDEPVANLDPLWQLLLMELVRDLCRDEGRAALLAMHDLDLAARFSDRLIVVESGRIVADAPPQEIVGGGILTTVFGIARDGSGWRPLRRPEDPRSLR